MSFDYTKDPTTHAPEVDETFNTMERWGIVDPIEEDDGIQAFASKMTMLHGGGPDKEPAPEQNFIQKLKDLKIAELKKYEKESGMIPCKRDYVFDLKLMGCVDKEGKDVVTRKFKCSGDMNLRTFAEKLLLPIMGYMRGYYKSDCWEYHAWVLTDQKDGAVFGTDAKTVDSMHMWNHGSIAMRDIDWTVAHVLRKQEDALCWIYNLGDQYRHMITATEIRAPEASDGRFKLLGGTGAQPAEDHQGNRGWQEIVTKILEGKDKPSLHKQISEAGNYRTIYKLHGSPQNWRLDPLKW